MIFFSLSISKSFCNLVPLMTLKKELIRVLGGDEGPFPSHSREVVKKKEYEKQSWNMSFPCTETTMLAGNSEY